MVLEDARMQIVIPGRTHPSLNEWVHWHWAKKAQEKESWIEEIGWLAKQEKIAGLELQNARVEIRYYFPTKHRKDADNYTPKFLMDSLVQAGVIVDDNASDVYINWKILYDKDNPRTEIHIYPEEEAVS
jgi:crossover junction endodeoxyribonuclease RusA